jgi:CBS domain-containing protein
MAQQISEVMTRDPKVLDIHSSLADAARLMRDNDIGFVVVRDDHSVCGVLTDRDLVVRGLAEGADPANTTLEKVYSKEVVQLDSDDSVDEAIALMRERAIRRLPVVHDGQVVGVVSLGDLAMERDPNSVLGEISAAPANE